jgi:hypothetical protein
MYKTAEKVLIYVLMVIDSTEVKVKPLTKDHPLKAFGGVEVSL